MLEGSCRLEYRLSNERESAGVAQVVCLLMVASDHTFVVVTLWMQRASCLRTYPSWTAHKWGWGTVLEGWVLSTGNVESFCTSNNHSASGADEL